MSNRLIEEVQTLTSGYTSTIRAAAATASQRECAMCQKTSHMAADCYLNPLRSKCKLDVTKDYVGTILGSAGRSTSTKKTRRDGRRGKKLEERSAIARNKRRIAGPADRMMLDSGTTSHLKPKSRTMRDWCVNDTSIYLADDSVIFSTHVGDRKIDVRNDNGNIRIRLSDTLVVPEASMSLLSILALVRRDIAVLFLPSYVTLLDIRDGFKTLGYATENAEGLFYVNDDGSTLPPSTAKSSVARIRAMMVKNMRKLTTNSVGNDDPSIVPIELGKNPEEKRHDTATIWHLCLGHALPFTVVQRHIKDGLLPDVKNSTSNCDDCVCAKMKRNSKGSLTNTAAIGVLHVRPKVDWKSSLLLATTILSL